MKSTTEIVAHDETFLYKKAFELLSENTQEYDDFVKFIEVQIIQHLPTYEHLLDIGAGRGNLARPLSAYFQNTTIIEPNSLFFQELMGWARESGRSVTGYNASWENVQLDLTAELILISHVLYYVPMENHLAFINKAFSHLCPGGCMVLTLNSRQSDIWKLAQLLYRPERFAQLPYAELLFANLHEWNFPATFHLYHSKIMTNSKEDMRFLIDFLMLGNVDFTDPIERDTRELYLEKKLRRADGYQLSNTGGIILVTKPVRD